MNTIHSIIESESCRITKRQEFVESLREGLQQYKENTEKDSQEPEAENTDAKDIREASGRM